MIYKENDVFTEALSRIRMLFDTHEEIIVCMSGGKDSTVVFNLALIVAKEKGRLPLKVFWLDQEAEWQHTVDYMDWVMRLPEVEPYWYQIPFDFTNSLSAQTNFLKVFDEAEKDKWIHPKSDISIKENPTKCNRYHDLVKQIPAAIRLGMQEVPCIITHADEEAIKADRIADNKISEFSEWVNEELMHEIDSIDLDFDFSELGFPKVSFDDIPSAEDFGAELEQETHHEISEDERQKLYAEFLEQQAKENAQEVQMTTQKALDEAKAQQKSVAGAPPRYYKVVCEKCGHIMFVKEGDICDRMEE